MHCNVTLRLSQLLAIHDTAPAARKPTADVCWSDGTAGGWWLVGEVCKWSSFIYFIVCFQFVYRLVYSTIYISWVPIFFFVKAIIRFFCGSVLQTTNSVDTRTNSQDNLGYYWFLAYWPINILQYRRHTLAKMWLYIRSHVDVKRVFRSSDGC